MTRKESRWAFMSRKVIGPPDNPMLIRWRLIQTPIGGVYLHFIHREDLDRDPHDHPWTFWTWVIRGQYIDSVWPDARLIGTRHGEVLHGELHKRWSFRKFPREQAHRITATHGKVTSLVIVGPKVRTWGFYGLHDGRFIDWKDYSYQGQKAAW